jgi:hypothetical protein
MFEIAGLRFAAISHTAMQEYSLREKEHYRHELMPDFQLSLDQKVNTFESAASVIKVFAVSSFAFSMKSFSSN